MVSKKYTLCYSSCLHFSGECSVFKSSSSETASLRWKSYLRLVGLAATILPCTACEVIMIPSRTFDCIPIAATNFSNCILIDKSSKSRSSRSKSSVLTSAANDSSGLSWSRKTTRIASEKPIIYKTLDNRPIDINPAAGSQ